LEGWKQTLWQAAALVLAATVYPADPMTVIPLFGFQTQTGFILHVTLRRIVRKMPRINRSPPFFLGAV